LFELSILAVFYIFYAIANLRGKSCLEIGSLIPIGIKFYLFGVKLYIYPESQGQITAESGSPCTTKHQKHDKRVVNFSNTKYNPEYNLDNTIVLIF
jgi:hypothetical protein